MPTPTLRIDPRLSQARIYDSEYGERLIFTSLNAKVDPLDKLGKYGVATRGWFAALFLPTIEVEVAIGTVNNGREEFVMQVVRLDRESLIAYVRANHPPMAVYESSRDQHIINQLNQIFSGRHHNGLYPQAAAAPVKPFAQINSIQMQRPSWWDGLKSSAWNWLYQNTIGSTAMLKLRSLFSPKEEQYFKVSRTLAKHQQQVSVPPSTGQAFVALKRRRYNPAPNRELISKIASQLDLRDPVENVVVITESDGIAEAIRNLKAIARTQWVDIENEVTRLRAIISENPDSDTGTRVTAIRHLLANAMADNDFNTLKEALLGLDRKRLEEKYALDVNELIYSLDSLKNKRKHIYITGTADFLNKFHAKVKAADMAEAAQRESVNNKKMARQFGRRDVVLSVHLNEFKVNAIVTHSITELERESLMQKGFKAVSISCMLVRNNQKTTLGLETENERKLRIAIQSPEFARELFGFGEIDDLPLTDVFRADLTYHIESDGEDKLTVTDNRLDDDEDRLVKAETGYRGRVLPYTFVKAACLKFGVELKSDDQVSPFLFVWGNSQLSENEESPVLLRKQGPKGKEKLSHHQDDPSYDAAPKKSIQPRLPRSSAEVFATTVYKRVVPHIDMSIYSQSGKRAQPNQVNAESTDDVLVVKPRPPSMDSLIKYKKFLEERQRQCLP